MRFLVVDIETTQEGSIIGSYDPQEQRFKQVPYTKESATQFLVDAAAYDYLIGFNLVGFDLPHLIIMSRAHTNLDPNYVTRQLIQDKHSSTMLFGADEQYLNTVMKRPYEINNIIDVMPLMQIYAARENGNMLPFRSGLKFFSAIMLNKIIKTVDFDDVAMEELKRYNRDDLLATWRLFEICRSVFLSQKTIGDKFGLNMCVKTNSSMIKPLLERILGHDVPAVEMIDSKERNYDERFVAVPVLERYLEVYDKLRAGSLLKNSVVLPLFKEMNVTIGLGGIHAISKKILYPNKVDYKKFMLLDLDVVSQYPTIYTQLDRVFHPEVNQLLLRLLEERKEMKRSGSGCKATIGAYKILLNGIYGKLHTDYPSVFKNSVGLYRVTTSGQLMILYMAHMLDRIGLDVVYLNTDGLTILLSREREGEVADIIKLATEYANRFFKDVELEAVLYEKGVFFNVNGYGLKEMGKEAYKFKKEFRRYVTKSQPGIISKMLQERFFGIEYQAVPEDYLFLKTSKDGINDCGNIMLVYFSLTGEDLLFGKRVKYIYDISELDIEDVAIKSYVERADEFVSLSEGFDQEGTEQEMEIMKNSVEAFIPKKKDGSLYAMYSKFGANHLFFDDIRKHNQYVVLNKPVAKVAKYVRISNE